jgi:hypothetical protein
VGEWARSASKAVEMVRKAAFPYGARVGCTAAVRASFLSTERATSARPRLLLCGRDQAPRAASGVRREKAALFQWVQIPPGNRSSRKQPEQSWRQRNG